MDLTNQKTNKNHHQQQQWNYHHQMMQTNKAETKPNNKADLDEQDESTTGYNFKALPCTPTDLHPPISQLLHLNS